MMPLLFVWPYAAVFLAAAAWAFIPEFAIIRRARRSAGVSDAGSLKVILYGGQVAFRYCAPDGTLDEQFNPNGSAHAIAGVRNDRGNVVGMMPHPERAAEPELGCVDGLKVFRSMVGSLATR